MPTEPNDSRGARTIAVITPASRGSRHGNRVTAARWALLLRQLGHRPFLATGWSGRPADALLALHAHKSAGAVRAFRQRYPHRGIGVLLSGTDVYPEFRPDAEMAACLHAADVLIALQPEVLDVLPRDLRDKTLIAVQSAAAPAASQPPRAPGQPLRACVLAHLRAVKDPLLAFEAARLVDPGLPLSITVAGKAMEPGLADQAKAASSERCRWIGGRTRQEARELLARSDALIVTSRGEGGANVVSEAIAAGVPVLATAIPGNTGLLGRDWPGLFPVGDAAALARLLERLGDDAVFAAELRQRTRQLQPMVHPDRERQALAEVLRRLP